MAEVEIRDDRSGSGAGALGTVRNAVLLLDLLSDGPAYQQLTDLAERSGLSLPTVHRLLRSLVLAGLVEQDPRSSRYGLGPQLVRLSQRYLARLPVLAALSPYLLPVRDAIGASVYVVLLVRGAVAYVDRAEGADATLYRDPHRITPALRTAAGRLLAARADDHEWHLALELGGDTERDEAIRERDGWRDAEHVVLEHSEGTEVAVPVLGGSQKRAIAALTVTVSTQDVSRAANQLARAAAAAGRTLAP